MSVHEFKIDIGTIVQTDFLLPDTNKEHKGLCRFIGVYDHKYIILSHPEFKNSHAEIFDIIEQGRPLSVRYLYNGDIFGFSTTIDYILRSPHKLLFVKYPQSIQMKNLRRYPRVQCKLGSTLEFINEKFKGIVRDLSIGGLRFEVSFKKDKASYFNGLKEELNATMDMDEHYRTMNIVLKFPGFDNARDFKVIVRNIEIKDSQIRFGCEFADIDIEVQGLVAQYIESIAG